MGKGEVKRPTRCARHAKDQSLAGTDFISGMPAGLVGATAPLWCPPVALPPNDGYREALAIRADGVIGAVISDLPSKNPFGYRARYEREPFRPLHRIAMRTKRAVSMALSRTYGEAPADGPASPFFITR